ncbi:MAG TPA: prolyl-tRNA synthetase associated domain-containing protein [Rhizobiales bacterium]|nr:prolyl-tRNA synthetase associated domain-containing protein [Hyphomicrobiales bacterium]
MPATPEDLFARLESLAITVKTYHHPPLFTVEDSRKLRGDIPGAHCKNLFLKDKKGALWLIVTLEETKINLKTLHKRIGAAHLSFGKPELLRQVLGVAPGSVTPFALMNETQNRVTVILDSRMMAEEILNFHPLTNEMTSTISSADLLKFIRACGFSPVHLEVAAGEH